MSVGIGDGVEEVGMPNAVCYKRAVLLLFLMYIASGMSMQDNLESNVLTIIRPKGLVDTAGPLNESSVIIYLREKMQTC